MMEPSAHLQKVKQEAAGAPPFPGDLRRIRALRFTEPGFDRDTWREMCAKGWLRTCVAKAAGGAGLGVARFCGLAERLGADLAPEPLIAAAMAAVLLPPAFLPAVLSGERIVLPAWQEEPGGLALTTGATTFRDGRLNGRKLMVPMAAGADAFLVTVPDGLALVARDAPGLGIETRQTADGGHVATLTFDNAPAEPIEGDATAALEQTIMATASYLLGLAERAFAITQEHIKRSVGGDAAQLVQPRVDDIRAQLSLTRSVVRGAAAALDEEQPLAARQAAVSRAKMRAADAAMMATRTCVQLHGAIRDLDVRDVALYVDKAMAIAPLYGSQAAHRVRVHRSAPE